MAHLRRILQSFTYSAAPSGDVLTETDTPSSSLSPAAYTYDAQGQVTSMTPGSNSTLNYGFDASGALTTTPTGASGTYDKAGELTSSTGWSTTTNYTYNADGQRLTATQGSTTVASGTWNGDKELTAYSDPGANMTAATYNGNGLRATTTTGGTAQDFVSNTQVSTPELLMDSNNAYIYADGRAPAEQVNLSTGAITYLVTDRLGSVRGAVNSSGMLTGTTSYDAWGNPESSGGLTAITPFGFAGGYTDPGGLIYLLNRYYDPSTGQFISTDPALAQTNEPYAYGNDNPVSNTDPTGLYGWRCLDWTCGYEWSNSATNAIDWIFAYVGPWAICARVTGVVGSVACGAVVYGLMSIFSLGYYYTTRCLYYGVGWGTEVFLTHNGC